MFTQAENLWLQLVIEDRLTNLAVRLQCEGNPDEIEELNGQVLIANNCLAKLRNRKEINLPGGNF